MTEIGTYERKPIAIIYEEKSAYKDTYAGAEDIVFLEAHHLIPSEPKQTQWFYLCIQLEPVVPIYLCLRLLQEVVFR